MIEFLPWQDKPSDETLVAVSEYLSHIAEVFQARHRRRIRRHYRTCQSVQSRPGACHERQLHLFGEPCPPFSIDTGRGSAISTTPDRPRYPRAPA